LGELHPQLGWDVEEPELGILDGQCRLGVEGAVHGMRDAVRAGAPLVLQLDAHDLLGELVEHETLRLGVATLVFLGPRCLHGSLPPSVLAEALLDGLDESGDHAVG
jgi:hypothetical protein